jgi:glyoxylate utilization-related uncharacterized protein
VDRRADLSRYQVGAAVRNAAGQAHLVTVYYRDYREVDGVRLPFVIESGAGMARAGERS